MLQTPDPRDAVDKVFPIEGVPMTSLLTEVPRLPPDLGHRARKRRRSRGVPPTQNVAGSSADGSAVRVFIVEDHPAVHRALHDLFAADRSLVPVGAASDPGEVLTQVARLEPHVVLVDDCLGARSGLVLTRQLKALEHPPSVLILSAYADALLAVAGAVAGADGLISKGVLGDELCRAVRALARGHGDPLPITPHAFRLAASALDPDDARILALLCHATPPSQIAHLMGMTPARLDTRRGAMLKRLTDVPGLFWSCGSRSAQRR
jgi:DNA-binding NarL/FixJ family response regulator